MYKQNSFRTEAIQALDALSRFRSLTLNESLALERAIRAELDEGAREEVAAKRTAKGNPGGWASYPVGGTV